MKTGAKHFIVGWSVKFVCFQLVHEWDTSEWIEDEPVIALYIDTDI